MTKYAAESDRLWLQPLSLEHLDDFHLYISSEEGMKWSPSPPSKSLEETRIRLTTKAMPTPDNPAREDYALLLKDTVAFNENGKPTLIGTVGVICNVGDGAQIGYGLHPDYQGKGYGTEALRLFIDVYWAPGRKSQDILISEIDIENPASENIVRKLGFKKGERKKDAYQLYSEASKGIDRKRDVDVWTLERPK